MEQDKSVKLDIVITTWKREWMMENCVKALRLNTKTPYRLIIIDNGSSLKAQIWMNNAADIYVRMDKNYGLEHVKWLGMHLVQSDLFISMDNDILVYHYDPDWLGRLVDLMNRYPEYGAIACRPQTLVADSMGVFNTDEEVIPFPRVPGYARIMRTAWVNEVGAWRDRRPSRGHEEMWICGKFAEKGYKTGWANNVGCWHMFGEGDTDEWGYPKDMTPEQHGHNPVWPMPKNDKEVIREKVGIKI